MTKILSRNTIRHTMGRLPKNCNDGRFLSNEERLYCALGYFLKHNLIGSISISDLTRKAKIWKSTFYNHFKNIDDALARYDHKYDDDILKLRRELEVENCSIKTATMRLLFFISKHKNYYKICLHCQNPIPIFSITKIFCPIFTKNWSNFGREKFNLCFRIFSGEVYGVICYWGNFEHFDYQKIKTYATYLSNLAKNTTKRLV